MNKLRLLLWPFSMIYGMLLTVRHGLYNSGFWKSTSFKTPSICVGNLSLGGTGKTPMIALLLNHYKTEPAKRTAVLSRGYGRISQGIVAASKNSTVADLGDEPYQLANDFPESRLVVAASRVAGMNYLESPLHGPLPDLVLLDDAMQHRALIPSFNLLLTSFSRPFPADALLPVGTLRDLPSRAQIADLIVVTKCPEGIDPQQKEALKASIAMYSQAPVVFSYLEYAAFWIGLKDQKNALEYVGKEVTLVTAIANPEPLVLHLKSLGILVHHKKFQDHHFFTPQEIDSLRALPNLCCTQKDFVKLKEQLDLIYYIPVRHAFFKEDARTFYNALPDC